MRICAAHGAIDQFAPDPEFAGLISLASLEQSIAEGKIRYAALGDRRSLTKVNENGCVCYSGTPETTDFDEAKSGYVDRQHKRDFFYSLG